MAETTTIKPIPITGYASISGCGLDNESLYRALSDSQTALAALTLFAVPFSTPVAEVSGQLPEVRPELEAYNCRNARMALAALNSPADGLRDVVEQAKSRYGRHRIGVVIGTSTSGLLETESAYAMLLQQQRMPDDFHFLTSHAYQATPRFLHKELELGGPCFAISTACSSGAKAIAAGQRLILTGICDAVLVGGVDTLCRLTLRGFNSLELVAENNCRPMDKERHGINIGEGAGLLLLEKPSPANKCCVQVLSVGESSDAHHMSSPHPEGLGASLAMQRALHMAGLQPDAIDYINLHATATKINDRVEGIAIYNVFGDRVPCSGTKGVTGHTLGAAGAIEAIIALLALQYQFIPGTCGLKAVDDDCRCLVVKQSQQSQPLKTVMSNSFGFGGNNASMIFSIYE
jgi:3-oxoacyl-[acyl-carrier-protein] synthase I